MIMKKKSHLKILIIILIASSGMTFWSCKSEDETPSAPIAVQNEQALIQSVYADDTQGTNVQFTTAGAWTSSIAISGNIVPVPGSMSTTHTEALPLSTSGTNTWISIEPNSGDKAGNYDVTLNLEPNFTGETRSAVVTLVSEGQETNISVTQQSTAETGYVPDGFTLTIDPNADVEVYSIDVTAEEKIKVAWGDGSEEEFFPTIENQNISLNHAYTQKVPYTITVIGKSMTQVVSYWHQYTVLDMKHCPMLEVLSCEKNKLATLNVSQCPSLTRLYCNGNQLTTLDVSHNPALVTLNCNDNQLTTLDITNNPTLTYLFCGNNQLATLDITNNPALEHVYCNYNNLTAITLASSYASQFYPELIKVEANNNELSYNALANIINKLPAKNRDNLGDFCYAFNPGTADINREYPASPVSKFTLWWKFWKENGWFCWDTLTPEPHDPCKP
jgi:hypothetical protein